ncbi:MAG: PH domain-containing protein [Muribaculaceae bacterium]|nr:PH domain-containing protein [Muribaculaceae bacterium]MDE6704048.1 PH domain-containing protein [Muribaculaceae bacterium]
MATKTVYKSKIDWWVVLVLIIWFGAIIAVGISSPWWLTLIFCIAPTLLLFLLILGCRYEIDGDTLIIYQFFKPHRFPISKIKSIKKTTGYLATAGMSSKRVSISFVDRSVMKSAMPLEISPKNRDGFMSQLKEINPEIIIG